MSQLKSGKTRHITLSFSIYHKVALCGEKTGIARRGIFDSLLYARRFPVINGARFFLQTPAIRCYRKTYNTMKTFAIDSASKAALRIEPLRPLCTGLSSMVRPWLQFAFK